MIFLVDTNAFWDIVREYVDNPISTKLDFLKNQSTGQISFFLPLILNLLML